VNFSDISPKISERMARSSGARFYSDGVFSDAGLRSSSR